MITPLILADATVTFLEGVRAMHLAGRSHAAIIRKMRRDIPAELVGETVSVDVKGGVLLEMVINRPRRRNGRPGLSLSGGHRPTSKIIRKRSAA